LTNNFNFGITYYEYWKYQEAPTSKRIKKERLGAAEKRRDMASQRTLPYIDWSKKIYFTLQCETGELLSQIRKFQVLQETEPKLEKRSGQASKGDSKMHKYPFKFNGGAKKLDKANYKFHAFLVDTQAQEHHLYGAMKTGIVEKSVTSNHLYSSATPVIKVFSATAGFGVPKEFFSYFIMLSPEGTRRINIKPLGFKSLRGYDWTFSGVGRFMKKEEVRRFFGASSDTWKFYQRQSFLSRFRLQELVTITDAQSLDIPIEEKVEEVRMLRFD
jgi:hypothetical protein